MKKDDLTDSPCHHYFNNIPLFQRRLVDIYAKFDVINLAAEKTYSNLDVTLKEANQHRNEWFEGVHKCRQSDTLYEVMEKIVKAEVRSSLIAGLG